MAYRKKISYTTTAEASCLGTPLLVRLDCTPVVPAACPVCHAECISAVPISRLTFTWHLYVVAPCIAPFPFGDVVELFTLYYLLITIVLRVSDSLRESVYSKLHMAYG
jgi:hypothetical protein